MDIEKEVKRFKEQNCRHKCHSVGLNPWVESCPVCGCPNPHYKEETSKKNVDDF